MDSFLSVYFLFELIKF